MGESTEPIEKSGGTSPFFRLANGVSIPSIDSTQFMTALTRLHDDIGVSPLQVVEGAGYSMAMVVRSALALSAEAGRVCVLASDCLAGCISLSALRQLVNAGAEGFVILFSSVDESSENFKKLLQPLDKAGVAIAYWSEEERESLAALVGECHNVILGLWQSRFAATPGAAVLSELLNDLATPVHTIGCTLGVNQDSGAHESWALYPSSTLSLGAPLSGLSLAKDFVGRHYLCDISIPRSQYIDWGFGGAPLFSEQPVIKILPAEDE